MWLPRDVILVLVLVVVATVVGLLRGGSLESLANTSFRWLPVLFGSLIGQLGFQLWDPDWLTATGDLIVLLATQMAVAVFFGLNWKLPGMALAATGFVLNVLVIGPNGAMPVSAKAVEVAGGERPNQVEEFGIKHERLDEETVLPWLADVIPVPGTGIIVSVGDIVLAAGIGWLVYRRTTAEREEGERPIPTEVSG